MGLTLKGGPELKVRLASIAGAGRDIQETWQRETVTRSRMRAPTLTGKGRSTIRGRVMPTRAEVRGAFWLIFIDRGTKAHEIKPQRYSGSARNWYTSRQPQGPEGGYRGATLLRFERGGQTVFAKKVHKRRQARNAFLTEAAQRAIAPPTMRDEIVKAWSRKRRGRFSALA